MHLSKRSIDAIFYQGSGTSRDIRWDDKITGFGVRVYPSGRKAFVLSYRYRGRLRLMTLGPVGQLPLLDARKQALQALADLAGDIDPLQRRQDNRQGSAVRDLVDLYLTRHVAGQVWEGDVRHWCRKYILPAWGSRQIASITRADAARLHALYSRSAPIQANRMISAIHKMFDLAKSWGYLSEAAVNPAARITRNRETKRDRWMTPEELPRLVQAIDLEESIYIRAAIWLYMLTGMRKSELLATRWEDIDLIRRSLRIPDPKGARLAGYRAAHHVPLSSLAVTILERLPREEGNPYLLPGRRPGRHLVNIHKPWTRIRARAGIEDVRLHDLRRTVGSWLAQSGASLHLIGHVLGHKNASTTQIYARFGQDQERQALEQHGRQLLQAAGIEPSAEVVDMPSVAGGMHPLNSRF